MATRSGLFVPALVLLVAGPSVHASAAPVLAAQAVEWPDAEATAGVLALRDLDGAATFALTAAALRVHAVVADAYSRMPTSGAGVTPGWSHEESDLTDAALRIGAGRPGSFLYLMPSAARLSMACGAAQAASGSLQAPSQIEQPNPNAAVGLGDALPLVPCGPVEVCGAFTVVLWERDAAGSSAEGDVRLESGQLPRPGEPDARPFLGSARQLYLTTSDGCLSMDGPDGPDGPELFAHAVDLGGAKTLLLRAATGALPGDVAVDGDLLVAGRLDAALARQGAGLGVALAGTLERAEVDGRPVGLSAAAASAALPRWAWAAALGLALPLALAAALWARANRPEALRRRAERAWREQRWGRVLHLAQRRLRRGDDPRTRILHAKACLALADFRQALAQAGLALLRLPDGPTKADAALVACRAASRLGRDAEALALLGEVYAQDVATAEHALRHPEVARLTTAPDAAYT